MKNVKTHLNRWGEGKVHYQAITNNMTPHGFVHGFDTDEPVNCKKCLHGGQA